MTQPPESAQPSEDIEAVRAEIDAGRAQLVETVDALGDKLDVKSRVGQRVEEVKGKVSDGAARAKASAPEPVQHALERAGEKASPVVHDVATRARPYRKQIAIGAALAVVIVAVVRRRRDKA